MPLIQDRGAANSVGGEELAGFFGAHGGYPEQ